MRLDDSVALERSVRVCGPIRAVALPILAFAQLARSFDMRERAARANQTIRGRRDHGYIALRLKRRFDCYVGWGRVDLRLFSPAYLESHHVRYFVHDPRGADYFNSSGQMLTQLQRNYDLREIARLCGKAGAATCDSVYMTIYELMPKAAPNGS